MFEFRAYPWWRGRPAARIGLDCRTQRASRRFEHGLGNVVRIPPVVKVHVEVHPSLSTDSLPEISDQLAVECADLGCLKCDVPDPESATAQVDGGGYQSFVHGKNGVTVPPDARAVAEHLIDGLTQADADVLGRMMRINVQIAGAGNREIHQRMPGEEFQHVVQKSDTGGNPGEALSIQGEPQSNISLASRASDFGDSWQ